MILIMNLQNLQEEDGQYGTMDNMPIEMKMVQLLCMKQKSL